MSVSKLFLKKWQKVGRTLTKTFIKIRAELGYEFGLFYQDLPAEVCFLKVNVAVVENIASETDGVGADNAAGEKLPMFVTGMSTKPRVSPAPLSTA